jgi:hypothetical protein
MHKYTPHCLQNVNTSTVNALATEILSDFAFGLGFRVRRGGCLGESGIIWVRWIAALTSYPMSVIVFFLNK